MQPEAFWAHSYIYPLPIYKPLPHTLWSGPNSKAPPIQFLLLDFPIWARDCPAAANNWDQILPSQVNKHPSQTQFSLQLWSTPPPSLHKKIGQERGKFVIIISAMFMERIHPLLYFCPNLRSERGVSQRETPRDWECLQEKGTGSSLIG